MRKRVRNLRLGLVQCIHQLQLTLGHLDNLLDKTCANLLLDFGYPKIFHQHSVRYKSDRVGQLLLGLQGRFILPLHLEGLEI